ncbi:MAG: hypothetical protein NT070_13525 [Cyanobacteria bacterium]|nr:hypothetical protein [Cyanobacteriota bacterium]
MERCETTRKYVRLLRRWHCRAAIASHHSKVGISGQSLSFDRFNLFDQNGE